MNEFEFKRLVERYQQGVLSDGEKALLEKWFDELGTDAGTGKWTKEDKLRLKWQILGEISGRQPGRAGKVVTDFHEPPRSLQPVWGTVWRVAASVIVVAVSAYMFWPVSVSSPGKEVTAVEATTFGELKKVILPDRSIVWLKNNSTLEYPREFTGGRRNVILQGEALFEVSIDPARPFIIQCGGLTTTVLGTSFNIKASEENVQVDVLTGQISLTAENHQEAVIVSSNEKAMYSMKERQIAKIKPDVEQAELIEKFAAGTEYRMHFEDTKMEEVIRRIEGKFNVNVQTRDPQVRNCLITANFTGQSLEETLNMISQVLGFAYEITDRRVILSGPGCDRHE